MFARRDQDAFGQLGIAGILDVSSDGFDRHLVEVGIEIATDHEHGIFIRIEQVIDDDTSLQSLADPLQR